jgi:hypothetical protein
VRWELGLLGLAKGGGKIKESGGGNDDACGFRIKKIKETVQMSFQHINERTMRLMNIMSSVVSTVLHVNYLWKCNT